MNASYQPYADYIVFSPPAVANFWRHRKVPQPAAQIRFASKAQPPIAFFYGVAAICQEHGRLLAEYSFAGIDKPIGISTYRLTRALPRELRSALPTVEAIEAELGRTLKRPEPPASRRRKTTASHSKKT